MMGYVVLLIDGCLTGRLIQRFGRRFLQPSLDLDARCAHDGQHPH